MKYIPDFKYQCYDVIEAFITERVNNIGNQLRFNEALPNKPYYKSNKKKLEFALDTYSNVLLLIAQERAILNEVNI